MAQALGAVGLMHEAFVKFDGFDGECQQAKHEKWIDVVRLSYSAAQETSFETGGGGGVGRASFGPIVFTHTFDKASPNLFAYCAAGTHIETVIFSICKAGDGSQEFAKITLSDVIITNVGPGGKKNGMMMETVALAYAKIVIEVGEQTNTGSMNTPVRGGWDVQANEAV